MAERPFEPVPNTPLVADPTGDAIWKRWLQNLQRFLASAVRGPGSSTDNAVARWDGTSGQFLNNSGVIIDDSNNVSGIVNLTTTGSTILGDASADTLTINAGTWTLGNNFIATRAAGTLAAGATSLCDFQSTFTGHSGGTTIARPWAFTAVLQGANNVDRTNALTQTVNHSGSGTLTIARSINNNVLVSSTGTITTARGVESIFTLSSSGNITTGANYYAETPAFTSTGAITTLYGFQSNIAGNANTTNAIAFYARDMSASTVMTGMELALSAGTGKKNLNITGTADNYLAGRMLIGSASTTTGNAGLQLNSDGTASPNSNVLSSRYSNDAQQGAWVFRKARGTTASPSSVVNGDALGGVEFQAYDGTGFIYGGTIVCEVDGTPGTNDMPTSMYFSVAADGASTPTRRVKLSTTGNLIAYSSLRVGSTAEPTATLDVTGTLAVSGIQNNANKIYPGTDAAASQSAAGIYAGSGAPNNANGSDGDFYFRSDGGVLTTIYHKRAGAWVGVV